MNVKQTYKKKKDPRILRIIREERRTEQEQEHQVYVCTVFG